MIVALDLDGVIYDWEQQARVMLEPIYGPIPVSTYWHFIKDRVRKEDWNRIWKNKQMLLGGGRLVETNVLHYIRHIQLKTSKLPIVVTSRRPEAESITREWLNTMTIPFASLHVIGEQPKTSVPFDILLDDKPEHVEETIKAGRRAFLRDQPWNQRADLPRVADMSDFLHVLGARS